MDNLRLVLIILGGVAILGLLLHGLYVMRKNNSPKEHWDDSGEDMSPPSMDFSKPTRVEPQLDAQGFDEFGVGKARVVSTSVTDKEIDSESQNEVDTPTGTGCSEVNQLDPEQKDDINLDSIPNIANLEEVPKASPETPIADEGPKYAPAVSNPKPVEHYQNKAKPAPLPEVSEISVTPPPAEFVQVTPTDNVQASKIEATELSETASPSSAQPVTEELITPQSNQDNAIETPSQQPVENTPKTTPTEPATQTKKTKSSLANMLFGSRSKAEKKQRKMDENQFSIDFDSVDPVLNEAKEQARAEQGTATQAPKYDPNIPPEVLCISVRAKDENSITGAKLLPLLLTLGLKFGDSDIFHRHVNNNGKGPVLFSLANMFKPGVFDIHHMETFETKGLTLFMTLPTESDAHQVFNMMHNAARKIADEFGAQVLDESRQELTVSGLPQYVERIRDFEKRRLLG